jgi:hypothetical protein
MYARFLPLLLSIALLSIVLPWIVAAPAFAAGPIPPPPPTAEELAAYMPDGARIEARLDADVTGDGMPDVVFVAANDDVRVLRVMMAYAEEVANGYDPIAEGAMEIDPLGAASLSVKKGVLLVDDLSGGTTAIQSLYRYRFDPKTRRMRLIGDDVTLYSRTNAHGKTAISTNRLTGVQIVKRSEVGENGYTDQPIQKKTAPTTPVYMEGAPLPSKTLGWGD